MMDEATKEALSHSVHAIYKGITAQQDQATAVLRLLGTGATGDVIASQLVALDSLSSACTDQIGAALQLVVGTAEPEGKKRPRTLGRRTEAP